MRRNRGSGRRALAGGVLVALSLVAAACGGSSSESTSEEGSGLDSGVKDAVANQLGSSTTAGEAPTTTAAAKPEPKTPQELLKLLDDERAAQVKKIKDNGWGVDKATNTLKGPEGFSVDLNACPDDWSETEGLTDTEIKVGAHIAQSGPLADYGNMLVLWQAYIDEVNDAGGIKDSTGKTRKIKLITKDDRYDPTVAVPLVDELLDSDKTFLIWGGSSPITLRIYQKINKRCVPEPFVWTGHPAWGDPINHPWTVGSILNYYTEAILWGTHVEQNFDRLQTNGKVRIGALAINSDFGAAYTAGLKAYLAGSKRKDDIIFEFEKFEPTAPTITSEMTNVAAKKPDVFIMMSAGATCAQAINEAAANGIAETAKELWMPSVCKALSFVGEKVVQQNSEGWLIAGGGIIDINDPNFANQAGVQYALELLKKKGVDPKSSSNLSAGFYLGMPIVQMLKIASELPGGLTRSNYLLAMRTLDMTNPLLLPGLRMTTNGNKDAYVIEGTEFARFDTAKQAWVQFGNTVDLSGVSTPCAWDQSSATCK